MKSKKRHQSSEDESDESDASARSSSSESESEDSSASEHRHRKKKKRADSSESDSDSDDHRRSKKRKHKKKKKKHVKRKRRSDSVPDSRSDAEGDSSVSEGEVSPKKKRKKHKQKRSRSSSGSVIEVVESKERRLHSVVKERRRSSEEEERPTRTYYQKEYRSESPVDELESQRQREVQRFYRGSSKERRYQEQFQYEERQHQQRYEPNQQEVEYSTKNTFHQSSQFNVPTDAYQRGQRGYQGQRNPRYEGHHRPGHTVEFQRRPREENYQSREPNRGFNNRYNQYEERGPKRNFVDGRDNRERERRAPPEAERFREREFPERRERYNREEPFQSDRPRDVRRDKPPPRVERPPPPPHHRQEPPRSESVEDRYRDRSRRPEPRQERGEPDRRDDRFKEERDGRNGREPRRDERRPRDRPDVNTETGTREKKSRFADGDGDKEYSWGKTEVKKEGTKEGEKEKPNFGLSGKLTADANTVNGVVIKYTEPDDAKQPKRRWRFYPFKGDKALPILYIHRQSAFLIGRDKKVCDITLEHPSISKQHAALQYRATPFTRPDGTQGRRVRPYVIDLESANGTFVNNKKIEVRRYVELLEKDVVKFGFSQREYVLLHENSKDDAQDDDNQEPPAVGAGVTTTNQIKQEKRVKLEAVEDGE